MTGPPSVKFGEESGHSESSIFFLSLHDVKRFLTGDLPQDHDLVVEVAEGVASSEAEKSIVE